jgi:crossover junction endodeoxyribonuclease RusA
LFFVEGTPVAQGSKKHVGGGRLVEMAKGLKPWRKAIVQAAQAALPEGWVPLDGPVRVTVVFYRERGKTVKRDRPSVPPDLDKMVRACFDALTTAGVWVDDSRVVTLSAAKYYADLLDPPGMSVRVEEIERPGWEP